jgi:hypothetical protein
MNLKQATLIALIGISIAFTINILQFALFYENYLRMGIGQLLLAVGHLLFYYLPLIIFFTVLRQKQQGDNHDE